MARGTKYELAPDAPHTFPEWIRERAKAGGDKVALEVCGAPRTYAELDEISDRVGAGFADLGLAGGEHVALMMANSIENVESWFGLTKAGLVEIPIHTASRGGALQYVVGHADARALVIDEEFLPHLVPVAGDLEHLEHVIVNGDLGAADGLPARIAPATHWAPCAPTTPRRTSTSGRATPAPCCTPRAPPAHPRAWCCRTRRCSTSPATSCGSWTTPPTTACSPRSRCSTTTPSTRA